MNRRLLSTAGALGLFLFLAPPVAAQPAKPESPAEAEGDNSAEPEEGDGGEAGAGDGAETEGSEASDEGSADAAAAAESDSDEADAGGVVEGEPAGGSRAVPRAGARPGRRPGAGQAGRGRAPAGRAPSAGRAAPSSAGAARTPGAGAGSPGAPGGGFGVPLFEPPKEAEDDKSDKKKDAKSEETTRGTTSRVFAEDWWTNARPSLEFHGYFRLRAQLMHNFFLGRKEPPSGQIFPRPLDLGYTASDTTAYGPQLCTGTETDQGDGSNDPNNLFPCNNRSIAGANIRFRINPEIHVSDNLRVISQVDLLDNLVLGSTPEGYQITPDATGGYATVSRGGYNGIGFFDYSQAPPESGVNGLKDSIRVKRVWGEYSTPVGELRFGRMPWHWGTGMMFNAGDAYDDDAQTTVDRIMFTTGVKSLDLYVSGAWDFPNEGPTTANSTFPGLQAFDAAQLDDVDQYMLSVARLKDPALQRQALAHGEVVLNGGAQVVFRKQVLANDLAGNASSGAFVPNATNAQLAQQNQNSSNSGYVRRDATAWVPDLWFQLLYQKFSLQMELVTVQGSIENTENSGSNYASTGDEGFSLNMWGFVLELQQKLIEDRLRLDFKFGWASGDGDIDESGRTGGGGLVPPLSGGQPDQLGDNTISNFAFHPSYRVDLILHRNILTRVHGTYYFRPEVEYDFIRSQNGQKLGGGISAMWTRASSFLQTPGHKDDLGIELNGRIYFQSKDGALNDNPENKGGFFTMLEYGVLFPLGGLSYQDEEAARLRNALGSSKVTDLSPAQILRWYAGIFF